MDPKSRIFFLFLSLCMLCRPSSAQRSSEYYHLRNYKDHVQFKKFHKRKKQVGAWQINQLRQGALVVRLKTREHLLRQLATEPGLRKKRLLEQTAVNYNISAAFRQHYHFSKVYFIYSSSSDSLLKGVRSGIFLDSNLVRDASIIMEEKFYLVAEPDYYFSSSIGFVPESLAKAQIERGHPVRRHQLVVKNKYGHQLKGPFPYTAWGGGRARSDIMEIDGSQYEFLPVSRMDPQMAAGRSEKLTILPELTYDRYSRAVLSFNKRLERYLRKAGKLNSVPDTQTEEFFY